MRSSFTTRDGLAVVSTRRPLDAATALDGFAERLDGARGGLFSSGVDYPGRYSRWAFGFADPPLELVGHDRTLTLRALNGRGEAMVALLAPTIAAAPDTVMTACERRTARFEIARATRQFAEEERSLQPSLMSPLRHLIGQFAGMPDRFLGIYGAFGYDLLFRFEPMALRHPRGPDAKDIHLFLPDSLIVVDRRKEEAVAIDYEFTRGETTTFGRDRAAFAPLTPAPRRAPGAPTIATDVADAAYAAMVDRARERIRVGDVFEVVLSRTFHAPYDAAPSQLYERMTRINPSPYEFLIQLGDEQLVGTSPEMFVRVEDRRVESCPISGTARRGADAMEDAARLKALINSEKDEVELTMCTDVDRNDKARVCEPGSVRLLARRQIETYAGLFHTVDHVEGRLRDGFDGIDAFLSHMWAVTLTGAPKRMAAGIVEAQETSARGWYGGAVGALLFNGDVNTGITIRTIHLRAGMARYRVGATIVWDSTGPEEERETRLKSTTLFRALAPDTPRAAAAAPAARPGDGRSVVLIDNEDSFVHTLADYFRQTGAAVRTFRHGLAPAEIAALRPDLVVHSPGPARPADFGVPELVRGLAVLGLPQFGVCLGLQGMVEAFGGDLDVLTEPRHGKTWTIAHDGQGLFAGLPLPLTVGAYHSLTARMATFPHGELAVTAMNETGLVMAIRHRRLRLAAVQFHPESILSAAGGTGLALIANAMRGLAQAPAEHVAA
jgi:anthranilate synthase